jgi:hypothetical protein
MSTKSSLASGDNFHFFEEMFENDGVYLTLNRCEFLADPDSITVKIPLAVWEVIRKKTIADFSLVEKTDEDIAVAVTEKVKERVARWEESKRNGNHHQLAFGSVAYLPVDAPEADQIAAGIESEIERREEQRALLMEIKRLAPESI